jgi:hypothetical protein
LSNVVAVDGGDFHVLALKADGTVASWGYPYQYTYGQTNVPVGLSNVVAVAAGDYHSLALGSNGLVFAWGLNDLGQSSVPSGLSNVVAVTAGNKFSVALKNDGTVVQWGSNLAAKPADVTNIVAISAGEYHFCLALTAGGRVRAWGDNYYEECNVPANATNVVAIAAGMLHCLALRSDGTVLAWGRNDGGCANVPAGLSNVVAIAAGAYVSVALKADGTAIAWGWNGEGQTNAPAAATNIVGIGAGYRFSLYVNSASAAANALPTLSLSRGTTPARVRHHLWAVNGLVRTSLDLALHDAAVELSGAKALFQAVLELGMPYTLERDDVLHGFLYGSEALADLNASRNFLDAEEAKRLTTADAIPQELTETATLRYLRFSERLQARLNDLQATGAPEIPRLLDHTLRLLNLLRDAWTPPANSPPPALEIGRETNALRLVLYGEPYTRYTLQYRDSLSLPGWITTTSTNWRNEQIITPPVSGGPQRFYRGLLPAP